MNYMYKTNQNCINMHMSDVQICIESACTCVHVQCISISRGVNDVCTNVHVGEWLDLNFIKDYPCQ